MDQVSDVESMLTQPISNRSKNQNQKSNRNQKLTRHPSYSDAVSRASTLRKYASSPKLNSPQNKPISVQNLGPMSSANSMLSLKAKKNSLEMVEKKPLRKNMSAPMRTESSKSILSSRSSNPSSRKVTPNSERKTGISDGKWEYFSRTSEEIEL